MIQRIVFSSAIFFLAFSFASAQVRDVRIAGRVFLHNPKYNTIQNTKRVYTKYVSDFKVILIQLYYPTEITEIEKNKARICANEGSLLKKYRAKIYYSNNEGYYEFKGLQRQADYLLIFCDRKIQISQVQTGNSYTTYGINDKAVTL